MNEKASAIRRARPAEASQLSDIAFRSKAHWGYSDGFMSSSRNELAISSTEIRAHPVFVLEVAGAPVGFYSLEARSAAVTELNHLFLEPRRIGRGEGSALLEHAISTARTQGFRVLLIQSDPNAEGFYTARGATRVGERPSGSIPGRSLPVLEITLDPVDFKDRAGSAAPPGRARRENESGRGR